MILKKGLQVKVIDIGFGSETVTFAISVHPGEELTPTDNTISSTAISSTRTKPYRARSGSSNARNDY